MTYNLRTGPPSSSYQEAPLTREALARLIPLWPEDILDCSYEGRCKLIAKLERALRAERKRARAGSHAYDLARHVQLARAYRAERRALAGAPNGIKENGAETRAASCHI